MNLLLVREAIGEAFYGVMLLLDGAIYSFIASSYRIFMAVAEARILSSDAYTGIANKIYVIIGVVMLFVLAYAILKAIIDPDQMTKGKLSAPTILKKIVIAVLGLALTPVFFNLMYQGQALFMEKDVITNLFFRNKGGEVNVGTVDLGDNNKVNLDIVDLDSKIKDVGGALTAASVWQAFFYPDGVDASEIKADAGELYVKSAVTGILAAATGTLAIIGAANGWNPIGWVCLGIAAIGLAISAATAHDNAETISQYTDKEISLEDAYGVASSKGNFYIFCAFTQEVVKGNIHYTYIISSIVGCFVLYVFVSFSIDMGFRAAKLAYYQIIAPIPLILSVLPEFSENFNNYIKDVIRTFVEVFIRISVVYICIYIICHLTDLFSTTESLWGNRDLSTTETVLALAALILGLVAFAKTAPNLIGEVFGMKSGSMKLGIREKLANGGLFTAGSIVGSQVAGMSNSIASAVRSDRFKEKGHFGRKVGMVLGSGARGLARGSFDSAYNRIKEGKPVGSLKEAYDKSARAGERAGDKETRLEHGIHAQNNAAAKVREARQKLRDAIDEGDQEKISTAEKELAEARRNARTTNYETDPFHSKLENARRYFVGTADLKSDEQLLGAYASGSKTKDSTRDAVATAFKAQAAEIRQLDTEIENLTLEKMSEKAKADYMRKKNFVEATVSDADAAAQFDQMSEAQQREGLNSRIAELQARRKRMNDIMETGQDFSWVAKLATGDEKAMKAANALLEQSYLWKQNASQAFEYQRKVWSEDSEGHWGLHDETVHTTVGEFIRDFMGDDALEGRLSEAQMAAALAKKDETYITTKDSGGHDITYRVTHKLDAAGQIVLDANHKPVYIAKTMTTDGSEGAEVEWDEATYTGTARTGQAVENQSASNVISNAFRRSHVKLSNYINQTKQRQRQASSGGGGGGRR